MIDQLNDLRTPDDIDKLRVMGCVLSEYVRFPKQLQRQRAQFQAINQVLLQEVDRDHIDPDQASRIALAGYRLVMAEMDKGNNFPGLDIFEFNPKTEAAAFARVVAGNMGRRTPVPIFSPVCPDFADDYTVMNGGLSDAAKRLFRYSSPVLTILENAGIEFDLRIHLADADGMDEFFLQRLKIDQNRFRHNIILTRLAIAHAMQNTPFFHRAQLDLMLDIFGQNGFVYRNELALETEIIANTQDPREAGILRSLYEERRGILPPGELLGLDQKLPIACELAAYKVYGKMIHGQGLILSPDTLSGTAAYNFGSRERGFVNPVIGILGAPNKAKFN